jgi:ketosteroid isomerase-like protein
MSGSRHRGEGGVDGQGAASYHPGDVLPGPLDFFDYDQIAVRLYGDVAVVQSRSHQSGTLADTGEAWSGTFPYTDVWVRDQEAGWQIAVRHAGMRR